MLKEDNSKMYKKINFNNQKIKFIKNALFVWTIEQIILHLSLLILSIPISVLISNFIYVPLRYYFYGKNVFGKKRSSSNSIYKFLFSSVLLWTLNTSGTSFIHLFGLNKNISALIMIPFVASISFITQKYFVFKN